MKLIQFGAGNIGRSFVGQIFSNAGWEVVFIDIDRRIIDELNRRRRYTVTVKDRIEETIEVTNIRGIHASDIDQISDEIAQSDLISTAVGQQALPHIMRPIALGLLKRQRVSPGKPIDIVICENMRNAGAYFRKALQEVVVKERQECADFSLEEQVGFVETSIGKMVPIMSEKDRAKDPLLVYVEAYNTLIVDKLGFKGQIPDIPQLDPKENIRAYVDRKLYIHNLGHGVLGYTSQVFRPHYYYVWEAAFDRELGQITKNAMWESGSSLIAEYPNEFNEQNIGIHIDDLISRFRNKALGDTMFRAGRDLYRKLGPNDRLIGAVHLCVKQGLVPTYICLAVASAFFFKAKDENGNMYKQDQLFHENEMSRGPRHVLKEVCKIEDMRVVRLVERYHEMISKGSRDLRSFIDH